MPPKINSRYQFTSAFRDENGALYLSERKPFPYTELPDNIVHSVKEGDTLHKLAARYYSSFGRLPEVSAAELFWVIADFQPLPILDPTLTLMPGSKLVLPSVKTLRQAILVRPDEE